MGRRRWKRDSGCYSEGVPKRAVFFVVVAFLLAICMTFVFAYRVGRHARLMHWEREPIRPWMSVPFIAHVHHVPVDELFAAIGVKPKQPRDRRALRRIAHEEKRPVDELIRELNQAIGKERGPSPGTRKPDSRKSDTGRVP